MSFILKQRRIKKDPAIAKAMRRIGTTNPDIDLDGEYIVVRMPGKAGPGKSIKTNVPIDKFKKQP